MATGYTDGRQRIICNSWAAFAAENGILFVYPLVRVARINVSFFLAPGLDFLGMANFSDVSFCSRDVTIWVPSPSVL